MTALLQTNAGVFALALVAVLALATAVLGLIVWSLKRQKDPKLQIDCDLPLAELLPSLTGLTHASFLEGNAVEAFENETFFDAMFEAIASARHSITFEMYLWKPGTLEQRLVDALLQRRQADVPVRLMVDANGGKRMSESARNRLLESGCRLVFYHRRRLRNIGRMNRRDHRKLLVVDGRIGFVGGHCIVDNWLGSGQDREHFRDVGIRVRGPAVHALQSTFCENWIEETGELLVGNAYYPTLHREGDIGIHVASIKPEGSPPAVKILHHLALCIARERLWIQNPYFLPDPAAIAALGQAVARGVDVRVMVPSAEASDFPIVQHAAHRNFEKLLARGVRIFEYQRTLLHQKLMTVDGVWCAIGSSNFDERSFEINDEITVGLLDPSLARQFEAVFERDAADCVELSHESWSQRGLWHKLKDHTLHLFSDQF